MSETEVDLATLRSIARTLRSGGDDVEAIGRGRPGDVDAGTATGLLLAAMSAVTGNAATLCEGLNDAAAAVTDAHEEFATTDTAVGSRFTDRLGAL